jgi:hypothetical protein
MAWCVRPLIFTGIVLHDSDWLCVCCVAGADYVSHPLLYLQICGGASERTSGPILSSDFDHILMLIFRNDVPGSISEEMWLEHPV